MIDHVKKCFENAEKLISKLPKEILEMEGMTGEMTRHFYNNLLEMEGAKYLEIGTWQGSSSCSAMYGNKARVVLMDDFSGFGSPKDAFLANYNKHKGQNTAEFIEADCFKFDVNSFKEKFNIYLFDGDHSEDSQYKAVKNYLHCLEDRFILVVDDWNWKTVRDGTNKAIADCNLKVEWKREIRLTDDDQYTKNQDEAKATWWNGIGVFIINKSK